MIILVIHVGTAPQHFIVLNALSALKKWLSQCTRIMCCFANSLNIYRLYFNDINMTQQYNTIKYIHPLCSGSNSLRMHEQLISGCLNSSELNSPNIISLDLLLVTYCTGSSSPRGNEQLWFTVRTALSQTALNSVVTSSPSGGKGRHLIE